jgi:hypothetical protein
MGCPRREVAALSVVPGFIPVCGSVMQESLGGASEEVRVSSQGVAKSSEEVTAMSHIPGSWKYSAVVLSSLEQ